MPKILESLVVLVLVAAPVSAGDGGEASATRGHAGKPAPEFSCEKLIQAPVGARANLRSLRGRVVVIEFWEMGCGPCVSAIPSWNQLVDRFAEKSVTFIAVTGDEDSRAFHRFLTKHPIRGWIALDPDRSTQKAYGVNGIPRTAVVNRQGVLVGWTRPQSLQEEPQILERVLRGEPVKLANVAESGFDLLAEEYASIDGDGRKPNKPLFFILIRPASGSRVPSGGTSRERRSYGMTLREVIQSYYPVRGRAVKFEFEPPEDKYDIVFRWPKGAVERGQSLLRNAIEATFDISVAVEKRLADVYVMTVDKERMSAWEPETGRVRYDAETGKMAPTKTILDRMKKGEAFFFTSGPMEVLTSGFSYALDRPIVDETGLDGGYTLCFPWSKEKSTVTESIALFEKHLGLTFTPAKREVEVHVVRHRSTSDKGNDCTKAGMP